jgi:hypothetical protein
MLRHAWVRAKHSKNRRLIATPLNDTAVNVLQLQIGKHEFTYLGKPIKAANTLARSNA